VVLRKHSYSAKRSAVATHRMLATRAHDGPADDDHAKMGIMEWCATYLMKASNKGGKESASGSCGYWEHIC
jgi:hypothetical protein